MVEGDDLRYEDGVGFRIFRLRWSCFWEFQHVLYVGECEAVLGPVHSRGSEDSRKYR
jgi:hypothetical protein